MDNIIKHIILTSLVALLPIVLVAQLSPGDLTEAHKELEGLSNCTQCHDIGNKVPNSKCLECHQEIQSLLSQDRGFHVSKEAKNKDCTVCHSEHHGRKFEMDRFDQNNFDHSLTGYDLDGEHGILDCKSCHIPDFITDAELKKRANTFLGLEQACLSCHEDFHQSTLSNDCAQCHDFDAFRPATLFDHDNTDFPLTGKHIEVDCKSCHSIELRNGLEFQNFANIASSKCIDCHDTPHAFDRSFDCTICHSDRGWNIFRGGQGFNHNMTEFELKGSHAAQECFACHDSEVNAGSIFSDQKGITESDCIQCHEDVHLGKFGEDCASCHNEESFYLLNDMSLFDHDVTDYPLEGLHQEVDCKLCHKSDHYTDPIDFTNCLNCHEDYHTGDFIVDGEQKDCNSCHTVEEEFSFTTYGLVDHQESPFPLEGAHIATPCFACHLSEDHWSFRSIGNTCIDCHEDIHESYISEVYYPDQDCTTCHSPENWSDVAFDHATTNWELTGQHAEVSCQECHIERGPNNEISAQKFVNLSTSCFDCHDNPHGDQFAEEGVSNCIACHSTQDWYPELFDHSNTDFPLDGKHAEVECRACHNQTIQVDGTDRIIYQIESFECIDCHL